MPTVRIPLVGVANQRTVAGSYTLSLNKDQRYTNCIFNVTKNPITGKAEFHLEKRPGWAGYATVSAGNSSTGSINSSVTNTVISAFGSTDSTIYDDVTSVGAITGKALYFSETILSSIGYVMIRSSDGTGWYYASNSRTTLTYTGDTHTNTTIDNISSTTGMYSGQAISGTGIAAGTRILSVDSATAITTDTATTGTATVTITKTPVAKILDSDFVTTGTNLSGFVAMNGYLFYCSEDGRVYNSDVNTVHAYTASNYVSASIKPDFPSAMAKYKNNIICFGRSSIEFFYNSGNASGSPLNSSEVNFKKIGTPNQRGIAELEDDIFFVTSGNDGDVRVELLRGGATKRISTPEVEKIIGTVTGTGSNMYLSAFQLGGYSYLSLIATTGSGVILMEDISFLLLENSNRIATELDESLQSAYSIMQMYNIELDIWSEWSNTLSNVITGGVTGLRNQIIATSVINTGGKIYAMTPATDLALFTDDGSSYTSTIITSATDLGTSRRKAIKSISLVGDIQSTGTMTLEKSDDDYSTWQTLGTFDLTKKVQRITRCGAHRGSRAYRLTHSSAAGFRAQALDIEYDLGA